MIGESARANSPRAVFNIRVLIACAMVCMLSLQPIAHSQKLIDPVLNISNYTALPTGLVSYGLSNIYSDTGPYQVATNEIIGYAKINAINTYNSSLPYAQNLSSYGTSLQLNAVMNVTASGHTYVFWLQNVVDFNTSNSTYYPVDNIWNWTTPTANMTNAVSGYGNVTVSSLVLPNYTEGNQTFYVSSPNVTYPYSLPLTLAPFISLSRNGQYPMVQMGYFSNGKYTFYDNATILIPNGSASMIVTPYYQPLAQDGIQNASYYDAELVFGGETNGTTTNFTRMDAELWLGYMDNGSIVPFPALATFALDTGESATNLTVGQGNGYATLTNGYPDYNATILLSGLPTYLAGSSNAPKFASNTTLTTTIYVAPAPQSGAGSGLSSLLNILYILIVMWAVYRIFRRFSSPRNGQPPPNRQVTSS